MGSDAGNSLTLHKIGISDGLTVFNGSNEPPIGCLKAI